MEKQKLGRTELMVAPLGFGGIPIQRVSREDANKIIRFAVEQGLNFIDSARGYTDSEEKIGFALQGIREKVILATKTMSRTGKNLTEDIDISLKNFKAEVIVLYQCHNVRTLEDWEQLTAPGGGLEALESARQAGKIRYIGITGHRPEILARALREYPFATVQFPYNYIEQENREELFREIERQELGTIIMKPLAGGAIRHTGPALRFLLQKGFSVIIPGMDSVEQVRENVQRLDESFSPEDAELLEGEKKELGQDFCRRCEYCLPCSAGINIPFLFLQEGYYRRYNLKDWAIDRYRTSVVKADACIDCGLCETRCPYQLPIREKLKQVHELLG